MFSRRFISRNKDRGKKLYGTFKNYKLLIINHSNRIDNYVIQSMIKLKIYF